ncbi:hypothetical protein BH09ACT5_BH09ACT5_12610 [soil metagenome]
MLRSLGGIGRVLATTWPALLAWYLGGTLVRTAIITLASPGALDGSLGPLLLVPVIVLARLVSYIGMFLVLRSAIPGYRELAGPDVAFRGWRDTVADFVRLILASIGPFFTLYALIGLLADDLAAYASYAFRFAMFSDNPQVTAVTASPVALAVVIIAFAGRMLIKVLGNRLPSWTAIVSIYLDATWLFVALSAVSSLFGDITEWVNNRQVVYWWTNAREFLSGLWEPIRFVIEGIDWVTPVALQILLLPIAWLIIASIVYLRALSNVVEDAVPLPENLSRRVRSGVSRVPAVLRRYAYLVTGTWDEVGRPTILASRIILRAGLGNLGIFLSAYALLFAATQWFYRGLYTLVGGHDKAYWYLANDVLSAVISAITEPLRVTLLAVAFGYCLQRWSERARPATVPELSGRARTGTGPHPR